MAEPQEGPASPAAESKVSDVPADVAAGRLDLASVRQLLELMREHDLAEIEIEQDDLAVRLRKAGAGQPVVTMAPSPPLVAAPATGAAAAAEGRPAAAVDEGLAAISSPMVGTFYSASSPDAEPYVKVGDHVTEETVVCMIEAMKVFNEIRAEVSGTIERVRVKNAEPVEFGQALFAVRPD